MPRGFADIWLPTIRTLVTLPRSDHLVALDRDRDEAIRATLAFLLGPDGA